MKLFQHLRDVNYDYSTALTEDAVFIIGGSDSNTRIAEYKNGKWTNVGKLTNIRSYARAIPFGEKTMIIDDNDPTVEIWNLKQRKILTTFMRPPGDFRTGFGVFLIDKDFCN